MGSIPSKVVGGRTYVHVDALPLLDAGIAARLDEAERLAGVERRSRFNLVRFDDDGPCVALLNYPAFDDDPFPALRESWLVNLDQATLSYRTYADSLNPPILHRKELLLSTDHPRREEYAALTATAESIGLFDEPRRIGYRRQWLALVREKGYRIEGHALVPLGNDESDEPAEAAPLHAGWQASRQLTAMVRYGFSAPVQSLARHGFLDGRYRLFDYGCGRGDDVRGLVENGVSAAGWDPYHAPDRPIQSADIVNLGFVINVIEDFDERLEALTRAWSLAERLLVVSVMLSNQNDPRGERFRDGVMTQRGTFQKYFSQSEIKAFLEQVLDEEAIPVAPGVLYVFRDKDAEQRFLVDRYRSRRNRLRDPTPRARERVVRERRDRAAEKYAAYQAPLERLWEQWLSLGRKPDKSETEDLLELTEGFGSLPKALRFLEGRHDTDALERAAVSRTADLEVYFALQLFERRKPYSHLESGLQRDIKTFFGDYAAAKTQATEQLFRIADIGAIEDACRAAAEHGLGWLDSGQSLQLHVSLVEQLPALLRIYVGCAAVLYGDYREADLVKIHIASGKVSLMRYDDFEGQPLPRLVERVKIKLRDLDIDYFAYGEEYAPPFLFYKSRYINEEFPSYPEQLAFEQTLDDLGLLDLSGYGPPPAVFQETLARHRWTIEGFDLVRAQSIPELDEPCGRFLSFRQLIECGETQASTGLANLPKQPESYNALLELAEQLLDPVIDYFGMIRLTYGFCSPELAKAIPGRIDPKRDQHAAHERNRLGNPVCERLGAAADFLVEDESMLEVAQWVVANTPFDRLYFYDDDLPIHVSHGPNQDRQIVRMVPSKRGRLVPRVIAEEAFLQMDPGALQG
ncbi:DNA phosphorothioation-associated putative methyltransferase [Thiorhodococcus mannitoliphagus]|uniref:DNA phosphorothioation-associated putative methyltransferase n=1 Tax=Thiorhodococcus mannitoliphagus TaxID=329406 RepID=A0A6P1DVR6_9GAMM|nr:DNA phosphorothioation-associated putative methyltransferase [Thiorhodococcus mannitoliphagus]NEX21273.1 DNA phosphorothioation-associated putative methyltransferase [Thiorhodococcus mannitoliphagus]